MEKYGRVGQATDDNIIRRMRFACWITKATDTYSEYVTLLLVFHGNSGFVNAPQCYVYMHISCLATPSLEFHFCDTCKLSHRMLHFVLSYYYQYLSDNKEN